MLSSKMELTRCLREVGREEHERRVEADRLEREAALAAFRDGSVTVMVATDLMGRGIDVPGVGHVIEAEFSSCAMTHLHRVGRTARQGRAGIGAGRGAVYACHVCAYYVSVCGCVCVCVCVCVALCACV